MIYFLFSFSYLFPFTYSPSNVILALKPNSSPSPFHLSPFKYSPSKISIPNLYSFPCPFFLSFKYSPSKIN